MLPDLETSIVEKIFLNSVLPSAGTMRTFAGTACEAAKGLG
jgi:hypothetical protein